MNAGPGVGCIAKARKSSSAHKKITAGPVWSGGIWRVSSCRVRGLNSLDKYCSVSVYIALTTLQGLQGYSASNHADLCLYRFGPLLSQACKHEAPEAPGAHHHSLRDAVHDVRVPGLRVLHLRPLLGGVREAA